MSPKTDNESLLVARAQAGDDKAFEELVLKYKDRLYSIASSVCARMPSAAEDVAQETFLSALKNISSFKANAAFSTWLYRIAANNCWQRFRKVKAERLSEMPAENKKGHPSRSCVNENALKNELSLAVSKALASLSPDYRIAITLCDIEGLSNAEAAGRLKISLAALKTRLHRARGQLKKQLADFR
ncbi:MAG: sigma-70 family RNA polymerase sigma factor [Elusimicrobiota bacterium]|nr:sigma-70 family RNA polymerase sigma factor [Elusimicrobiota bacterium]